MTPNEQGRSHLPGNDTLPPSCTLRDVSGREDRREADDDRDFWDALWDHAHRFAEENDRDD